MIPRTPTNLPRVVSDRGCTFGSAPQWHAGEGRLYWVDRANGSLHSFEPTRGASQVVTLEEKVHLAVIQEDGGLLLLTRSGGLATWRAGALSVISASTPWGANGSVDAAACDPAGRVFCAARPADGREDALYVISRDGSIGQAAADAGRTRGIAITRDGSLMYCADAASREITSRRLDTRDGALSPRVVIAHLPESLGAPHGLAIDAKGFLWVPTWGGACVLRISASGKEEQRVYFTARLLSGISFGGEGLREMYVTSGGGEARKENGPTAGALFGYRPGVRGAAAFGSRVGLQ